MLHSWLRLRWRIRRGMGANISNRPGIAATNTAEPSITKAEIGIGIGIMIIEDRITTPPGIGHNRRAVITGIRT